MMKTAIKHKSRRFRRFAKANDAVSSLEYAILVGVVVGGIGAIIATFGADIQAAFDSIGGNITTVTVPNLEDGTT